MKRFTSSIGITLLALLVSGWGNVLASAFCPHAMDKSQDRSQLKIDEAPASCHKSSLTADQQTSVQDHQEMGGMQMAPATSEERCHSEVPAIDQPRGMCTHCLGPNETATKLISAHGLILKKLDLGTVVEQPIVSTARVTAGFTPQYIPTQNAPPCSANRKHLLLSVFLI